MNRCNMCACRLNEGPFANGKTFERDVPAAYILKWKKNYPPLIGNKARLHASCHGVAVQSGLIPPIFDYKGDDTFIPAGRPAPLLYEERVRYNWHRAGSDSFWQDERRKRENKKTQKTQKEQEG